MSEITVATCWAWRHPRPTGWQGRCIGRTDLPVDRRRAKRLAHRIRHEQRRQGWPRTVFTSPLQRCAQVGRWLRRWGWQHHITTALLEADFGAWDGQPWSAIPKAEIDAWCADFLHHAPGGGESVHALFERVGAWQPPSNLPSVCVVAHAGWMLTRQWQAGGRAAPTRAADWPAPPPYGTLWRIPASNASGRAFAVGSVDPA